MSLCLRVWRFKRKVQVGHSGQCLAHWSTEMLAMVMEGRKVVSSILLGSVLGPVNQTDKRQIKERKGI